MDSVKLIDTTCKIKEIFNTMDYGRDEENVDLAMNWIKNSSFGPIPKFEIDERETFIMNVSSNEILSTCFTTFSISNIQKNISNAKGRISSHNRAVIMYKIINSIKNQKSLFCQLNLMTKGILKRHTENVDIPIMIDYLQYYAGKSYHMELNDCTLDCVGIILNEDTQLCTFMMAIAPIIANNRVYICSQQQFIPIIQLCIEIFLGAGLPKDFTNVVVVDEKNENVKQEFIKIPEFKSLIQIGSINEGKILRSLTAGLDKTLSMFLTSKSSMLIFNDADLDSVCNAVVDGAWTHSGKLPWSVSLLLVQEDVFEKFILMLKSHLSKLIFGDLKSKPTDIYFNSNTMDQLRKFRNRAKNYGIETFDISINNEHSVPLLAIGGRVDMNNVITNEEELPIVTVLPFRKVSEAISLANNTKFGLAASIWSENSSVSSKISKELQVSIVWINCHGQLSASVSICPRKQSGIGYFGGEAGLIFNTISNNYLYKSAFDSTQSSTGYDDWNIEKDIDISIRKDVRNKVEASKKALSLWMNTSVNEKSNSLVKLAEIISLNLRNDSDPIINNCITALYDWAGRCQDIYSQFFSTAICEPLGTIVIDCSWNKLSMELIIAAIANGNAIIIITTDKQFFEISKLLSMSGIPAGIMTVVTYKSAVVKTLLGHQDIQAFYVELQSNAQNENKLYIIEKESQYNLKNTFAFSNTCSELPVKFLQLITTKSKHILYYPRNV